MLDRAGDMWIFVEEYRRWHGKGRIVALKCDGTKIVERRVVLQGPHHSAFPRAIQDTDGNWLGTVDTCDPLNPIYTFDEVGEEWFATPQSLPRSLVDPVLIAASDESRLRLFATSAFAHSELLLEFTLGNFGWTKTRELKVPGIARAAGTVDVDADFKYVQDCTDEYGKQVLKVQVSEPGVIIDKVHPPDGWVGIHTINITQQGEQLVFDLWKRRISPFSLIHRVLEFRVDPCTFSSAFGKRQC